MHTKKDQHLLDKMTMEQKLKRVSVKSFAKRGKLVAIKEYWYITENEMPHVEIEDKQLIAWLSDSTPDITSPNLQAWMELFEIIHTYNVRGFHKNTHNNMSVKRYHVHLYI